MLFAKDAFNDFSSQANDDDNGSGSSPVLSLQIQSLAPNPIFSGNARPGSVITGRIYDGAGRIVGDASGRADVGGNWIVQFNEVDTFAHYRVEFEQVSESADIYGYLGLSESGSSYQALQQVKIYNRSAGVEAAGKSAFDVMQQMSQENNFGLGLGGDA